MSESSSAPYILPKYKCRAQNMCLQCTHSCPSLSKTVFPCFLTSVLWRRNPVLQFLCSLQNPVDYTFLIFMWNTCPTGMFSHWINLFLSFSLFQNRALGLLCVCEVWLCVDPGETAGLKQSGWVSQITGSDCVCICMCFFCVCELSDPIVTGRYSGVELQWGAQIYRLQPLKHEQTDFPQ